MKNIYILLICVATLFIPGCSKDFLKPYEKRIVGVWQITEINKTGVGGSTVNLPFKEGQFSFNEDGTLTYTNPAGTSYQGTWNIEKKDFNETINKSLDITVINFSNQEVLGEYYDDIDFSGTDHFKAKINEGLHTYVTHFRR